jgi:C1A family cysteine protease
VIIGAVFDAEEEGGGTFTILNSWGTRWGNQGFGSMTFGYFLGGVCSA